MENKEDPLVISAAVAPKKRSRTENWLDRDKHLLKELVRERVRSIENKNTDTNSNKKKKDAWADLHNTFNSLCTGVQRSIAQLKTQWSVMKITAKKEKALFRRESIKTGGGPCPQEPDDQAADDISSWLPHEFSVDSNEFDCDTTGIAVKIIEDNIDIKMKEPVIIPQAAKMVPSTSPLEILSTATLSFVTAPSTIDSITLEVEDPLEEGVLDNIIATNPTQTKKKETITKLKKKKLKKKTKSLSEAAGFTAGTTAAASKIMEMENHCRQELHMLQMENERKRGRNLDLEYDVLLAKLNYYKHTRSAASD